MAELEGVQAEDEAVTDTALALLERFAQRDERGLLELCVGLEKWDRDKLCALLEESVQLLRCALCCAVGRTDETDARRQAAARQAAGACPPTQGDSVIPAGKAAQRSAVASVSAKRACAAEVIASTSKPPSAR